MYCSGNQSCADTTMNGIVESLTAYGDDCLINADIRSLYNSSIPLIININGYISDLF